MCVRDRHARVPGARECSQLITEAGVSSARRIVLGRVGPVIKGSGSLQQRSEKVNVIELKRKVLEAQSRCKLYRERSW